MKKIGIVFVIIMLGVWFAACGAPAPAPAAPFGEADMIFAHDGVEYPISTSAAPLLKVFGDDYEEIVADSCLYVGEDKQFIYDFASISTYPIEGEDMIDEIYIYGGDFVTNRGIALGDTLEEVIEAYGEGGFEEGISYVYALSGDPLDTQSQRLYFDLTDGIVTGISYFGANNIVS